MRRNLLAVAVLISTIAAAPITAARADEPAMSTAPSGSSAPSATTASAPSVATASAPPVRSAPRGVIVLAMSDDAIPAARALAREVYAEDVLRPTIDDATARVLAGEAPPPNAGPKLVEIADVRKAAQGAPSDAVTKRLFTSLGDDLGAILVVPVTMRDHRPAARIVSVAKGAFEPVELSGAIEAQPDGSSRVTWSGVATILKGLVPKPVAPPPSSSSAPSKAPAGPLAPKKDEAPSSFWSSPWTWVGAGVVVAAGVVVFAVSQTQGDGGLRMQGRVAP